MSDSTKRGAHELGTGERVGAFLSSMVLLAGATSILYWPPNVLRFAPSAAESKEIARISYEAPWQITLALILGALGLFLYAANGRRIADAKGLLFDKPPEPSTEDIRKVTDLVSVEPSQQEESAQQDFAGSGETQTTPTTNVGELGIFALKDLPLKTVSELIAKLEEKGNNTLNAFEYALRKSSGKGNHPWYFRIKGFTGLQKLTMGGRGNQKATWTAVDSP